MKRMLFVAMLTGCTTTTGTNLPPTPPQLPDTTVKYERMVLFQNGGDRARLRGFDGAAPEGTVVDVIRTSDGQNVVSVTADAHGRFDVEFSSTADAEFELRPHSSTETATPLKFKARDRLQALKDMVRGRLAGTGSTPNQIVVDSEGPVRDNTRLVVVLSGDNAVQPIDMDLGLPMGEFTAFPDEPTVTGVATPTPWNALLRGKQVYVTRYGQGGISEVDLTLGTIESRTDPMQTVHLDAFVDFNPPIDADGDGVNETRSEFLLPRSPTGIAMVHGTIIAAYANVLSTDSNGHAQFGPGMVGVFGLRSDGRLDGNARFVQTRFRNPQHVVVMPGGRTFLVSAPGPLQRVNGVWTIEGEGGVEVFDSVTLESLHAFPMGQFAPGRPTALPDGQRVYVPSILRARIMRLNAADFTIADPIVVVNTDELRTTFECALHLTGLVFCGTFDTDSLTVIDSLDDTVRPWPFADDIPLRAQGTTARIGVQSLVVRPGRNGVDRKGNDIAVLSSLASQVVTLDTRFVLGP